MKKTIIFHIDKQRLPGVLLSCLRNPNEFSIEIEDLFLAESNRFHATTHRDAEGQYEFAQLEPGKYQVRAKARGLGKQVKVAQLLVSQPAAR